MRAVYPALHAFLPACVLAQTFTDCNPLQKACPADPGLPEAWHTTDFTKGANGAWDVTYGTVGYGAAGAAFTVAKPGDAPTMQTNFYVFFAAVTVLARAAPGAGIVSSAILESDDLDELDWEWLGGVPDRVQTNYFGKGNTTTYDRGTTAPVAPDAQRAVHNYTLDWTADATTWFVDGVPVRTLRRADALGGANYPQTPMRVKLGPWAAGNSPNPGTMAWAGGRPDFAAGPFTMTVEKVVIRNYNPAVSYTYRDTSGSSDSIGIEGKKPARRDTAPAEAADPTEDAGAPSPSTIEATTAQAGTQAATLATTLATTTRPSTTVLNSALTANSTMAETTSSSPPPTPLPATAATAPQKTWVPDLLADCSFPYICRPPL